MLGKAVILKSALLLLLILLTRVQEKLPRITQVVQIIAMIALILTFPLTGHAYASEYLTATVVIMHAIHMATAIFWLAGLAGLTMMARELKSLHTWTVRFAGWALPLLFILMLTGAAGALDKIARWSDLWTTNYGLLLTSKGALLLLIWLLVAVHRIWLAPRLAQLTNLADEQLDPTTQKSVQRLRLAYRAELAFAFIAFILAGILAVTPPPLG